MPLSTEDKLEIQELSSRFAFFLDTHDVDGWIGTFTEDGVFETTYGTFDGPDEIRDFIVKHIAAGKEDGKRHAMTNFVIEGDGDEAHMRSYVVKFEVEKSPGVNASGLYVDDLVRTADGWRFKRRNLTVDPGVFAAQAAAEGAVSEQRG